MNNFEFYSPAKVIFGRGVEAQVGQELLKWGAKKVLIHYGGGSVVRSGLLAKVEKSLEESGITNLSRYRCRTLPAAGALLKEEDGGQMRLL